MAELAVTLYTPQSPLASPGRLVRERPAQGQTVARPHYLGAIADPSPDRPTPGAPFPLLSAGAAPSSGFRELGRAR